MNKETRTFVYGLILLFIGIIYCLIIVNDYTFTLKQTIGLLSSIALIWVGLFKIEKTTI